MILSAIEIHSEIGPLRQNGAEVLTIPSLELSRGGGGPRCMTMPPVRKALRGRLNIVQYLPSRARRILNDVQQR